MTLPVVHELGSLHQAMAGRGQGPVATVMTLGALHEGHMALIDRARHAVGATGHVIVTIFVNPLQFGAGEDFARYPRTLEADVSIAARAGADVVYAPSVDQVYRGEETEFGIRVDPGPLGSILEGAHRPGHFAGVLTVVAILLNQTRCTYAPFGEKDYQQLTLVRAMVRTLGFNVEILAVPTMREPDGLARSSRNRFLSPAQRDVAVSIPRALQAAKVMAAHGAAPCLQEARRVLTAEHAIDVDYVELRGPMLQEAPQSGAARVLIAARVGSTRLLDNIAVDLGNSGVVADDMDGGV